MIFKLWFPASILLLFVLNFNIINGMHPGKVRYGAVFFSGSFFE